MTRQTSRLLSLTQPPLPLNGYWGIQQQQNTRIVPVQSNSGVVTATTGISWATLVDATPSTPNVSITSSLASSYTGYEKSTTKGTSVWAIYQIFLEYDTSFIGETKTITSASFRLFSDGYSGFNSTPTYELYSFDYGASLNPNSYRGKAWLNANSASLAATATTSVFTTNPLIGLKTFTNNNLVSLINKTGVSRFILSNDFHRTNSSDANDFLSIILYKKQYCFLEVTYI